MAEQTPQDILQESPTQSNQSISQIIVQAEFDARSLSEFVFKPYDYIVQRRLAPPIHTLEWYIRRLQTTLDQIDKVLKEDVNPDYIASIVLGALEGSITEGMLYPALAEKIEKIDINHDAILKETFDRVNAVAQEARDRAEALRQEANARAEALTQEAQKRTQAISEEALARSNALIEEARLREEALAEAIRERDAKIAEEARKRAEALAQEALDRHTEILAESEARALAISQEAQDRAEAILGATNAMDETLSGMSGRFDEEISKLDKTFTDTTKEIKTDLGITAEKLEAITVDYNDNKATFIQKITANATATESNAEAISGLVTKTDTSNAEILEIKRTYAGDKESWAET